MNWFQPHDVMLGTGEKPGRRTLRTVIQERLQTPEGLGPTDTTGMSDDEEGTSTSPSTETEVDRTQTTPEDGVVQPYRMAVSLHNGLMEATMALYMVAARDKRDKKTQHHMAGRRNCTQQHGPSRTQSRMRPRHHQCGNAGDRLVRHRLQ